MNLFNPDRIDASPALPLQDLTIDFPLFIHLQVIIQIRWIFLTGQIIATTGAFFLLSCNFHFKQIVMIINLSLIINALMIIPKNTETRIPLSQIPYYLAYDIGQLTSVLYLSGGLKNPLSIFILTPSLMAATLLSGRAVITVCFLVIGSLILLYFSPYFIYWKGGKDGDFLSLPFSFLAVTAICLICAAALMTYYVWIVSQKTSELNRALTAMQLALAKEQKMSSLGALATAAAHELGSPLSTISVVAKEIFSGLPRESPLLEDMNLLISQSARCRDILLQLSHEAVRNFTSPQTNLSLSSIIELAAQPHQLPGITITIDKQSPDPEPVFLATPAALHGLGNILQNAFQFAASEVMVTLKWDRKFIEIVIQDNGPGYPASLLPYLGQPYLPKRKNINDSDTRIGENLGLGLFIAQTLLSQKQGQVHFSNYAGARCLIRWPRNMKEPDLNN